MKIAKIFTAIPLCAWWIYDRAEKALKKKKTANNSNVLENLDRLYNLKKTGAISEADYDELKEKLKNQI